MKLSLKKIKQLFSATTVKKNVVNQFDNNLLKEINFRNFKDPLVSIIIPFYNQEAITLSCLHSLAKNLCDKYSYEIILIDDNSNEADRINEIKNIYLIRNKENQGFLKNINLGINKSIGEYVYILNNDTVVKENFLTELIYVFENFDNVGAVGSKLINKDGTLQEAGAFFLKNKKIRQVVKNKTIQSPEINYIYETDYCSGASLLFKKNNDKGELNLLDENYLPAYFEETDLCFRLKYIQNKKIYYTPFSEVIHLDGISYKKSNKSKKQELLK